MYKTGVIEVVVRLYLEVDVTKGEAEAIVDEMEYGFEHRLIADSDLYHYEIPEVK